MKKPIEVTVRGMHFKSVPQCARYFGVSDEAVYRRRERGTLDGLGITGISQHPVMPNARPIKMGHIRYSSRRELSRDLGFNECYVGRALRSGNDKQIRKIAAAFKAKYGTSTIAAE